MTTTVLHKKSSIQGKVPSTSQLAFGELAVNTHDGVIYLKKDPGTGEVVITLKEVTENNLSIDSSLLTNATSATLAGVLADLDLAITTNTQQTNANSINGATLDDIVALAIALG